MKISLGFLVAVVIFLLDVCISTKVIVSDFSEPDLSVSASYRSIKVKEWKKTIRVHRLVDGDTMGLISPASPYIYLVTNKLEYLQYLNSTFTELANLEVKYGKHMDEVLGFLAGPDSDRAADVNGFFSDPEVDWILSHRGGWGTDRIIPLLNFHNIIAHPKVIMGYSDLTALINVIYIETGLITFYGPLGVDSWDNWNPYFVKKVIFDAEALKYENPSNVSLNLTTINSGMAKGKLLGGNLCVFNTLLATPYFQGIKWEEVILFLEEVDEAPYAVDRYLQTLTLSGVLPRVAGVIWGTCTYCTFNPAQSQNISQVLYDHFSKLSVPVYTGAFIGHMGEQFTLPIGAEVIMDADAFTIQLLEPAVL